MSLKISCICPTYDRHSFLKESIKMFLNQTYQNKELVIIDDSLKSFNIDHHDSINYIHIPSKNKLSIGMKRNLAIKHATGDVIAFWDDDDYYHPNRLQYQYDFFEKDCILLFKDTLYYQLPERNLYKASEKKQKELWQFHGHILTSMMFDKNIWKYFKFKNVNIMEDLYFVKFATKVFDYKVIDNPNMFVYIKHPKCTWYFDFINFSIIYATKKTIQKNI